MFLVIGFQNGKFCYSEYREHYLYIDDRRSVQESMSRANSFIVIRYGFNHSEDKDTPLIVDHWAFGA